MVQLLPSLLKDSTICFDLLPVRSGSICLPYHLHLTCLLLMDALVSPTSLGSWCEICVNAVYTVFQGLIYGSTQYVLPTIHRASDREPNHASKDRRPWTDLCVRRGFEFAWCYVKIRQTKMEAEKRVLLKSVFLERIFT